MVEAGPPCSFGVLAHSVSFLVMDSDWEVFAGIDASEVETDTSEVGFAWEHHDELFAAASFDPGLKKSSF